MKFSKFTGEFAFVGVTIAAIDKAIACTGQRLIGIRRRLHLPDACGGDRAGLRPVLTLSWTHAEGKDFEFCRPIRAHQFVPLACSFLQLTGWVGL